MQAYCHCTDCREFSGNPFFGAALFPAGKFRILKGSDKLRSVNRSGRTERLFCSKCSSLMLVKLAGIPFESVPGARLRGEIPFTPTIHVNYTSKVISIKDSLPKFKAFPSGPNPSPEELCED